MTFVAGQTGQLAFLNNINDPWTAYTPTVKASATSVTLSSNNSEYKQVGKTVLVRGLVVASSAAASGSILVTVPVTNSITSNYVPIGNGTFFDFSAGTFAVCQVYMNFGSSDVMFRKTSDWGALTSDIGVGDVLAWTAMYEAT